MPDPYPGLTPAQLSVARALVEAPEWRWGTHSIGLRKDGALVEVMPGRALGMHAGASDGLVPLITDPLVVGYLFERLEQACGEEVLISNGQRRGPIRWWCALEAGSHKREWEGSCLGEALGGALLARWDALRRRERSTRARLSGREPPTGWARDLLSGKAPRPAEARARAS